MQGTDRIYEEPSPVARALVVGLSIAVVLMAGWFVATIMVSQPVTTSGGGDARAQAAPPAAAATEDGAARNSDAPRQTTRSVHFDWPAEFTSASAPPPARTALPLAPVASAGAPAARSLGPGTWPVVVSPEDNRASLPPSAGAAAEATGAIMDVLTPPLSSTTTAGERAAAAPQRQAQRKKQKPSRTDVAPAAQ